ncbi:hypothetical protein B0H11DRAFT_2245351 [Mycena galericulata]|nr:hypothetical protein B0H11DRAFT_2245351 [Mycena galericulata]
MILLNICNAWTDIALSTPTLWSAIHIVFPRPEGFPSFKNSGCSARTIASYPYHFPSESSTKESRQPFGGTASIYDTWQYTTKVNPIDLFGGPNPGPLPFLETLALHDLTYPAYSHQVFPGRQVLEFLRLAPNLVVCTVEARVHADHNLEHPVLPSLRRLMFGEGIDIAGPEDRFLEYLTAPRLEILSLSMHDVISGRLLSFLKRSSPPLQELDVDDRRDWDFAVLEECLLLVPTLSRFELRYSTTSVIEQLFATLANSARILPTLHSLTVHLFDPSPISSAASGSLWKTLLRALTARRTQLLIVHVTISRSKPAANILTALRELAAGGMDIFVGTGENVYSPSEPLLLEWFVVPMLHPISTPPQYHQNRA